MTRPSGLPVADTWFERVPIGPTLTLLREPHVDPLVSANIWHVRGRARDLFVDCGLGVGRLRSAFGDLFRREPILVLTHAHLDHMGSAGEFQECWAHPLEPVESPPAGSLKGDRLAAELELDAQLPTWLISAVPHEHYDPAAYRLAPARITRRLVEGDVVDLGDRAYQVLHLPGHSPGSIALLDASDGTLFSGDVVYDDELLDRIAGANIEDYRASLRRLRDLPLRVVHPGHGPSFERDRLLAIVDDYLSA